MLQPDDVAGARKRVVSIGLSNTGGCIKNAESMQEEIEDADNKTSAGIRVVR